MWGESVMQLTRKDYINMTTTARQSSNYWTTMALSVTTTQYQSHQNGIAAAEREKRKYVYDFNGVKCFVTADAPNDMIPCEPFCNCCAFPTTLRGILSPVEGAPIKLNSADVLLCDRIFTKCANPKGGRWFNEEREEWVEAEM
jgi:hypothetical protein